MIQSPSTSIHELRGIWESRSLATWQNCAALYVALARRLKHRSQPFWVFEITDEGRLCENCDELAFIELSQMAALSLARTGAGISALELLNDLLGRDHQDAETFCLLGRLQKDQAYRAKGKKTKTEHLRAAFSYYSSAAELAPGNYYPLINAATVAFLLANKAEAVAIAKQVVGLCREQLVDSDDYWLHASLGEAELLQGNLDRAKDHYRVAAERAADDFSSLQSMRSQARQILAAKGVDPPLLDSAFPMPTIVVFSGHRLDEPERKSARFPESSAQSVAKALSETVAGWKPLIAYASAAPGGDLIFCEAVLESGNELRLVLPSDVENFRRYILKCSDKSWLQRFEQVSSRATSVVVASHGAHHEKIQGPAIYDFVNRIVLGLARLEAQFLETPLQTMALWDGLQVSAVGGTADCIALWQHAGLTLDAVIDPASAQTQYSPAFESLNTPIPQQGLPQQTKAILFADIVGYSKLEDRDLPQYYSLFLQHVADTISQLGFAPLTSNSWGDAFYFVFESVREAGVFALEFHRAIATGKWVPQSTECPLRFRIALNAGPVFKLTDPVTGTLNYTGQHTNRAARIEPIVQEGQIYVSEYFAALAAVEQVEEFTLDYVGFRPLPKNYGSSRVFILREPLGD
jgi:class 3 adenylate cyclase